jgi:hypothetical protein
VLIAVIELNNYDIASEFTGLDAAQFLRLCLES